MDNSPFSPERSTLLVVDAQEKLAAAMPDVAASKIGKNLSILLEAAGLLGVRTIVTEQYPKGLGPTLAPLAPVLAAQKAKPAIFEKTQFDATANPPIRAALVEGIPEPDRADRTIFVTGMEAHICVYQTARGLSDLGFSVQVVSDATCSRTPENELIARELWRSAGAEITSTEAVIFDWLGSADHPAFRAISKLVK